MNKKVLIIGSNGYVSRFLVKELRQRSDILIFGMDVHDKSAIEGISFYKGDLCDQTESRKILADCKPNFIIHLASTFVQDLHPSFNINVCGSKFLLENILSLDLTPNIFFAGSAAEYGLQTNSVQPVHENVPANPYSIYGLTKLLQTNLATGFAKIHNLKLVVGRIFNLIGPGIPGEFIVGRIANQINDIAQGKSTHLMLQHLDSTRDFIDIRDVVKIVWRLVNHVTGSDIINIGRGVPVSIKSLVNLFINKAGLGNVLDISLQSKTKSDSSCCVADISRLNRYYSNQTISLEDSVENILRDQKANQPID
jgi:nucleoside-diphosphate-sugar epimerase